ncbi:hypothetical protein D3C75_1233230 [compost metagenome]
MHPGQDAVLEGIGVAANHGCPNALIQCSRIGRHQAAAGNPHTADGSGLHIRTGQQIAYSLHGFRHPDAPDIAPQQHQLR